MGPYHCGSVTDNSTGMIRINFQPYTTAQLETIVHARLTKSREGLPAKAPEVISKDGVKFASMKVSSISGDARRVLDICRCVQVSKGTLSQVTDATLSLANRRTVELVQPEKKTAGMREVKEVISAMQNSPTAGYLQELSLHERIMLASVLRCVKREGVEEVKWGDVSNFFQPYMIPSVGFGHSAHSSFFTIRFSTNTSFTRVF